MTDEQETPETPDEIEVIEVVEVVEEIEVVEITEVVVVDDEGEVVAVVEEIDVETIASEIAAEVAVEKVPVEELAAADPVADAAASAEREREAKRAIEAVVLATIEPVEARLLAQLVEIPVATVERLCDELAAEYEEEGRGFVLALVAGGYRFQTHPELGAYVERFVLEGQHARLSAPALETLAIIAYKQPISRGQMSAIRGVNVEATLNTLLQRGYVQEVGRDPGPGAAVLYGTTRTFLERLGLSSLDDLPPLGDFVPDPSVVEALERGLRITASDAAPDADASAPAEDAVPTEEEESGEAVESVGEAAPDPDAEAEALLADDPSGPLD